jgi:purine-nucleoside phosphorylase
MICSGIVSNLFFFDKDFPMARSVRPDLPETIIIAPTEPIYSVLRRAGSCTGRDRKAGLFRYTLLPACRNRAALAGPALGAPAAALLAERLHSEGVTRILELGVCGALIDGLRIGDLFIPTAGISEEGTSPLYRQGATPPPDPSLVATITEACRTRGVPHTAGPIWTTDAPQRETAEKIASFKRKGAKAVDMEFTALSTVARFYDMQFAALMVISDKASGRDRRFAFQQPRFKNSLNQAAQLIIDILGETIP